MNIVGLSFAPTKVTHGGFLQYCQFENSRTTHYHARLSHYWSQPNLRTAIFTMCGRPAYNFRYLVVYPVVVSREEANRYPVCKTCRRVMDT